MGCSKATRRSLARLDASYARSWENEEQHFEEHGTYSQCAAPGCNEECNPSNVHANGKKYCDSCWQESDE